MKIDEWKNTTLRGTSKIIERPWRLVVMGMPKIGKTSWLTQANDCCILCTEPGADRLNVYKIGLTEDKMTVFNTWSSITQGLKMLMYSQHNKKLLIVDTLDGVVSAMVTHIQNTQFNGNFSGAESFSAWGKGWQATANLFTRFLQRLELLSNERNMCIALTTHEQSTQYTDPHLGNFHCLTSSVEKSIWNVVHPWVDMIVRLAHAKSKNKQGIVSGTVRVFSQSEAGSTSGSRAGYHLPEQMTTDWYEFESAISLGGSEKIIGNILSMKDALREGEEQALCQWLQIESIDVKGLSTVSESRLRGLENRLSSREEGKTEPNEGEGN